ncbi:MAG: hypothetical protein KDH96_09180, partial [Candidatus Riesia sp.]|nr:hypothetical protein [Candidatus Riesia sp.]
MYSIMPNDISSIINGIKNDIVTEDKPTDLRWKGRLWSESLIKYMTYSYPTDQCVTKILVENHGYRRTHTNFDNEDGIDVLLSNPKMTDVELVYCSNQMPEKTVQSMELMCEKTKESYLWNIPGAVCFLTYDNSPLAYIISIPGIDKGSNRVDTFSRKINNHVRDWKWQINLDGFCIFAIHSSYAKFTSVPVDLKRVCVEPFRVDQKNFVQFNLTSMLLNDLCSRGAIKEIDVISIVNTVLEMAELSLIPNQEEKNPIIRIGIQEQLYMFNLESKQRVKEVMVDEYKRYRRCNEMMSQIITKELKKRGTVTKSDVEKYAKELERQTQTLSKTSFFLTEGNKKMLISGAETLAAAQSSDVSNSAIGGSSTAYQGVPPNFYTKGGVVSHNTIAVPSDADVSYAKLINFINDGSVQRIDKIMKVIEYIFDKIVFMIKLPQKKSASNEMNRACITLYGEFLSLAPNELTNETITALLKKHLEKFVTIVNNLSEHMSVESYREMHQLLSKMYEMLKIIITSSDSHSQQPISDSSKKLTTEANFAPNVAAPNSVDDETAMPPPPYSSDDSIQPPADQQSNDDDVQSSAVSSGFVVTQSNDDTFHSMVNSSVAPCRRHSFDSIQLPADQTTIVSNRRFSLDSMPQASRTNGFVTTKSNDDVFHAMVDQNAIVSDQRSSVGDDSDTDSSADNNTSRRVSYASIHMGHCHTTDDDDRAERFESINDESFSYDDNSFDDDYDDHHVLLNKDSLTNA